MKEREELKPYEEELKQYIVECKYARSAENKVRKALAEIVVIFKAHGKTWPDTSDIEEYRVKSEASDNSVNHRETQQNIRRIQKFFEWLGNRKENTTVEEEATKNMFPEEEAQVEEEPKGNAGRKPISENGEKKSEKLMLYLTPELIGKIRIWCDLKGISAVSYITRLIETDLEKKQDKIAVFQQLRNEA